MRICDTDRKRSIFRPKILHLDSLVSLSVSQNPAKLTPMSLLVFEGILQNGKISRISSILAMDQRREDEEARRRKERPD